MSFKPLKEKMPKSDVDFQFIRSMFSSDTFLNVCVHMCEVPFFLLLVEELTSDQTWLLIFELNLIFIELFLH